MSLETYDVVIVGGGTSGLVLANRLTEDPNLQVLVLESGNDRANDQNTLTPGAWPLLTNSPNDWTFQTVPQKDLARQITIPQGKALGGSSAINSFLFNNTSKETVDGWKALNGDQGWDYAAYKKALEKSFTLHRASGEAEGDGPLQLSVGSSKGFWEKAWVEGLGSVGFPETDSISYRVGGANIAAESIDPKTKQKSYAASAYLDPVRNRSNLTVRTETTVTKILLEKSASGGDAATKGVQFISNGGDTQTAEARKEVILTAGAINSPRLLELSGVGGAKLLQSLGIDEVVDNPHVGENLQNHLFTGLVFEANDDVDTIDASFRQEREAVDAAMQDYATKGTGPMSTSNMVTMAQLPLPEFHGPEGQMRANLMLTQAREAFVPDASNPTTPAFAEAHETFVGRDVLMNPASAVGNYVFGPAYAPFDVPDDPGHRAPGKWVSVAIELSHPLSRGSTHITSAAADQTHTSEGVRVDCRYLSHPLDLEVLARQVRFTEDVISRAEPLRRHLKPFAKRFEDLEAARDYVRRSANGTYHYTGTCAMMTRELGGVVDGRLRVYGVAGLRVCDASVLPIEPTANPQAVVYGVAELAAGFIKEDMA
ncbi:GMC oxidoreductase [Apiospora aurea]|uniref:GMC oxidoreductase n=1 Tax=Apiospora aurea TaxID=335848 RepID=A0ABR1QN56_9PEZI